MNTYYLCLFRRTTYVKTFNQPLLQYGMLENYSFTSYSSPNSGSNDTYRMHSDSQVSYNIQHLVVKHWMMTYLVFEIYVIYIILVDIFLLGQIRELDHV